MYKGTLTTMSATIVTAATASPCACFEAHRRVRSHGVLRTLVGSSRR
jgi:hypothetical protein